MGTDLMNYRGELAALSAALIWAIASIVYTGVGRVLSPLMLNLVKGLMAIALLIVTLLLFGTLLPDVGPQAVWLLLLSGALGIGLGDTAYFEALNCLGPRRSLVLEALAPPMAALLALIFLQEQLPPHGWAGILLTVLGVTWVVLEQTSSLPDFQTRPTRGVICGVFAAIAQAGGAVLSRAALIGTDISPLWSTFVRLAAGILILLIWLVFQQRTVQELKPLRSWRLLGVIAATAFASTYLGIWLQQLSLKYAPTGIAQALSATSPIFVIPIAAIALQERVSLQAILGASLALGGVWLLFNR
ncbi:MAG: DMT family transporter [Oscillatoriales cyanobacterium C42_A2020_001]|nr:DMT family transporter [Leptolyngbyaceae cyanobacterium C42_A2020_001]